LKPKVFKDGNIFSFSVLDVIYVTYFSNDTLTKFGSNEYEEENNKRKSSYDDRSNIKKYDYKAFSGKRDMSFKIINPFILCNQGDELPP
jgi:uncharacterized membrane protein YcgQ (UPF0703/DUF1980 family)